MTITKLQALAQGTVGNSTGTEIAETVNGLVDVTSSNNPVILCALDSLTAGAGGFSYLVPLQKMARGSVGWGGRWIPFAGSSVTGSEVTTGFLSGVANVADLAETDDRWSMSLDGYGAYSDNIGVRFTYEMIPDFDWVEAEVFYLQQPGGAIITVDYPTNVSPTPTVDTDGALEIKSVKIKRLVKGHDNTVLSCRVNSFSLDGKICVYGIVFKSGDGGPVWINAAKGGQSTETYISRGDTQVEWYTKLGVTAALINGGMNDRGSSTPTEFQDDLTTLCQRIKDANSAINIAVIRPNEPSDDGLTQYNDVYIDVAGVFGSYLDFRSGTYTETNDAGIMLDAVHPGKSYQWLMAQKACGYLFGKGLWTDTPILVNYTTAVEDDQ